MTLTLREGWTERIKYALSHDGVVLDLTGMTVALVGMDRNGSNVAFIGTVGIDTALSGLVYFDPDPNDLKRSLGPYKLRWKVTDGSGKAAFFPRTEPMVWQVDLP